MLLSGLVEIIRAIIDLLIDLFPSPSSLPSGINSAFELLGGYFKKANAILPVDTMVTIFSLILTLEAGILAFKISNWVINKFRGSG